MFNKAGKAAWGLPARPTLPQHQHRPAL